MGVNSLPKTVTRQRCGCDLNPGPSAPESKTLTTRLPSHPQNCKSEVVISISAEVAVKVATAHFSLTSNVTYRCCIIKKCGYANTLCICLSDLTHISLWHGNSSTDVWHTLHRPLVDDIMTVIITQCTYCSPGRSPQVLWIICLLKEEHEAIGAGVVPALWAHVV